MSFAATTRFVFAPPHPAGHGLLIGGGVVFLLGLLTAWWVAWLGLLFVLFCLYFFRDPERVPPGRSGLLLAPGGRPCRLGGTGAAAARTWAGACAAVACGDFPVALPMST